MGLFSRKISDSDMKKVKALLTECTEYAQGANTCVKPEVFFEKYDALEAKLLTLTKFEKYKIFRGNIPSKDLFRIQENRQNEINAMIQRSYLHAKELAGRQSDEAKKREIFQNYFDHMDGFKDKMNKFNRKVVDDLRAMTVPAEKAED